MNKKIFIIIGSIILILIIISVSIVLMSLSTPHPQKSTPVGIPTPLPSTTSLQPTAPLSNLIIIKTQPDNAAKQVPINQSITITFNRQFSQGEFSFSSWPIFTFKTTIQSKSLIITPDKQLLPNTQYAYYITYKNPVSTETKSFSTIGANPIAPDNSSMTGSPLNPYQGVESPDIYLSNRTPFTGKTFSVDNKFTSIPSDHYFFTVVLSDKTQGKQDFITWLHSIGFSDMNIQGLDIRYQ